MGRNAGLTTARVVDAAEAIADREGVDAISLSRVARDLGVRTPSLYNHVDGLDGLRRQLAIRAVEALGSRLLDATVGRSGPDALREAGRSLRTFALEHPGTYRFTVPSTETADDEALREAGRRALAPLLLVLTRDGRSEAEAVHASRALRAAVHGFVDLELASGFGLDADVDDSFERMLDALLAAYA